MNLYLSKWGKTIGEDGVMSVTVVSNANPKVIAGNLDKHRAKYELLDYLMLERDTEERVKFYEVDSEDHLQIIYDAYGPAISTAIDPGFEVAMHDLFLDNYGVDC